MVFTTPLPLDNQFNGTVSYEEAALGIETTVLNAKELLEDAKLLFENKRYPRSIAISILAIEEIGKIERIKELLLSKQKIHSLWKEVRSHKAKNFLWLFPRLKEDGINNTAIIKSFTTKESDSVKFLDQLKQICFYSEAIATQVKSCEWWLPSQITDKEVAGFYITNAHKIVLDDRIIWSVGALKIYKTYAYYKDGEVHYTDFVSYYQTLFDKGYIDKDRLDKIMENIKKSRN